MAHLPLPPTGDQLFGPSRPTEGTVPGEERSMVSLDKKVVKVHLGSFRNFIAFLHTFSEASAPPLLLLLRIVLVLAEQQQQRIRS